MDARRLADGLRRGSLDGVVFKSTGHFTALLQAVRSYDILLRDVVRAKHRLGAVCRSRGIATSTGLWVAKRRESCLHALPEHHCRRAELLGEELDRLMEVRDTAAGWLRGEASQLPIVRRLSTAPGIGLIRAAQIVSVVVTPWRFRTKRQFWSYCGLAVVTRSSSDWRRSAAGDWIRQKCPQPRGLNRNRNPTLKAVFKGAAVTVIMALRDHPLHHAYLRTLQHTKLNLARLTLARWIAAAVLVMWKKQEDYDPAKQMATTAQA